MTIDRNPTAPIWSVADYDVSVNEEESFGFSILTLSASDDDGVRNIAEFMSVQRM